MIKQQDFTASELARFRDVQRLAYACAESVGAQLVEGMTEKEAAALMQDWLAGHGVTTYFHKPFAWFGDRSAFTGFWNDLQFFPTGRRLVRGMAVILDVAPMVDGYVADIGWSTFFGGDNVLHAQMQRDLVEYRALVLAGIKAGRTFRQGYQDVDALIAKQGYTNAHRRYPQRVLAHRVAKVEESPLTRLHLFGFGLDQFGWLVPRGLRARLAPLRVESPLWNDGPESDHPPLPGLWAVEPHLACHGMGVKWEEILVITPDDAYWLDDETPHMRAAREAAKTRVKSSIKTAVKKKAAPHRPAPAKTVKPVAAKKSAAAARKPAPKVAPARSANRKKAKAV